MGLESGGLTWDPVLSTPPGRGCGVLPRWAGLSSVALCLLLPGLWVPALLFPWCWLPSCSGSGVLGFVGAMQMQPHGGGGPSLTQEASRVKELWLFCRNSGDLLDFHSAFSFSKEIALPTPLASGLEKGDHVEGRYHLAHPLPSCLSQICNLKTSWK